MNTNYLELPDTTINKIMNIIDRYLDQDGSIYAKYLDDSFECKGCEAVYVASLYPEQYNIYYTDVGWHGDCDYIISISNSSIKKIYNDLSGDIDNEYSFDEFLQHIFTIDDNFQPNSNSIAETYKSGFFLDEDIKSSKAKKYIYNGPVFYFKSGLRDHWKDETIAVSAEKALSNLEFRAKDKLGYARNANLHLNPHYLKCVETDIDQLLPAANRCAKCGTQLNDGGTCPICDDGEEDY